jgi:streptogramin lyase
MAGFWAGACRSAVGVVLLGAALPASIAVASPIGTTTFFSSGITAKGHVASIAAGPDGNMWFTESEGARVGRITPTGAVTEFSEGITKGSGPQAIAAGPDGNLWFTELLASRVAQITPGGVVTEFATGITPGSKPFGITAGPDGNLWFAERAGSRIGRIAPTGHVTEFAVKAASEPQGIAQGPDGNLWFTEFSGNRIGRITPSGVVTEFSAGMTAGAHPIGISAGPDGNLWFMGFKGSVGELGKVTTSGVISESAYPYETNAVAPGADGNLWTAEPNTGAETATRILPSSKTLTGFPFVSPASAFSEDIAPGPDGNLWFTMTGALDGVGRISSGAPVALVSAPAVTGGAQAGAPQQCSGVQWSTWAGQQPSSSLFSFDGYRWLLDGTVVATGATYTPTGANAGHALSCTEVVTYALLNVTSSATSAAAKVLPAPVVTPVTTPTPTLKAPPPALTGLAQSASTWREGSRLASLSRRRRPPVGTTFSFSLNESATVTLVFTRAQSGRRVGSRCVGQSKSNRHRPSCKRRVTAATASLAAYAGLDRIAFQGRVARSKRLALGRYSVLVTATNSVGRSQTSTLSFSIVR